MPALESSVATLRFAGDDLIPDEITALLGTAPARARCKGATWVGPATGRVYTARTGQWMLGADKRTPENLQAQVFEILGQLTDDLSVWQSLRRYQPDMFCGLFMANRNDGLSLSPEAMLALAQRGIVLGLDIYDPIDEREEDPQWRPR